LTYFLGGRAGDVVIAGDNNYLPGGFLAVLTGSLPAVPAASVVDLIRLGEERLPLRDLSFRERHLPWPLLTVPQNVPEINSELYLVVGREPGFVCSRGAAGTSAPGDGGSGIAVTRAGRRLWLGPVGSNSRHIGPPSREKDAGMPNAGAIDSESRSK